MNRPFENLGELVRRREVCLKERPVRLEPGESDEQIFSEAMKDVREIREFREMRVRSGKLVTKGRTSQDAGVWGALSDIVSGRGQITLADTQEYVEWVNPQCRPDTVKKLHEGAYSIQDTLDLHGCSLDEAESEVDSFLAESLRRHFTCVKIIHGRGLRSPHGPVIKQGLCGWLCRRHRKHVAGFVSARGCDGGLGATYVILKR